MLRKIETFVTLPLCHIVIQIIQMDGNFRKFPLLKMLPGPHHVQFTTRHEENMDGIIPHNTLSSLKHDKRNELEHDINKSVMFDEFGKVIASRNLSPPSPWVLKESDKYQG